MRPRRKLYFYQMYCYLHLQSSSRSGYLGYPENEGIKLLLNISTNTQVYMVLLVEDWKLLK
jgi:hypothetical protein